MPDARESKITGIDLPPKGWALIILLCTYVLSGLTNHAPWKNDDAISVGIIHSIIHTQNWLSLQLAGNPQPDLPLFYWIGALLAKALSWLVPTHSAARLASALSTLLSLQFILLAARELNGKTIAPAAPLILAGSIGFLYHAHEAQPMLLALAAHSATYWAISTHSRTPVKSTIALALSLSVSTLANGLLPLLTQVPLLAIGFAKSPLKKQYAQTVTCAAIVSSIPLLLWGYLLHDLDPTAFTTLTHNELSSLLRVENKFQTAYQYLTNLLWYAWPALPLGAWSMWSHRRAFSAPNIALPFYGFVCTFILLSTTTPTNSAAALLLLPPLALLATPGIATLRRGAANAFDWFGIMTFTLFACIAWFGWGAMVFGWPQKLAAQAIKLEPGFVGAFSLPAVLIAVIATMIWGWIISTSQRSPFRGITHWMLGLTLLWLLVAELWMPWIDYGRSYQPLAQSLGKALPQNADCLVNANLPPAILATFDYHSDIKTVPQDSRKAELCSWLIVQGDQFKIERIIDARWIEVWVGKRPGDRKDKDLVHLFKRSRKAPSASDLPEIASEDNSTNPLAPSTEGLPNLGNNH